MSKGNKSQEEDSFRSKFGVSRRQYMAMAGSAAAFPAIAGCTGGNGDGGGDEDTPTEDMDDQATPTATESGPQTGGKLRVSINSSIKNLDPAFSNLVVALTVEQRMVETLYTIDRNLGITNLLAKETDISDDGLEWTITLREGVQFHEPYKREMVAEDVVTNWDRVTDPDQGSPYGTLLDAIDSWEATGDYTLELTLPQPKTSLSAILTTGAAGVLSPDALEERGDAKNHPVGTGPFKFEEWQTNEFVRVSKNEDYWRGDLPHVDEVEFRPISEPSVNITELNSGDIDLLESTPVDFIGQLQDNDDVAVGFASSGSYSNVHINSAPAPTAGRAEGMPTTNPQVRRAINHVISRQSMVDVVGGGNGTITQEFYPESSPWHISYERYSIDSNVERANELIAEAGVETPVTVNIISASDNAQLSQMGKIAQENLNQADFDAKLNEFEIGTWVDKFFAHEYDLCVNFFPFYPDPDQLLRFYHEDQLEVQPYMSGNNQHEEVIDLWQQGAKETDQEKRVEIYTELQTKFFDDSVNMILYHEDLSNTWRNSVKGFDTHPYKQHLRVEEAWLDR